jgi:hypothetical protein
VRSRVVEPIRKISRLFGVRDEIRSLSGKSDCGPSPHPMWRRSRRPDRPASRLVLIHGSSPRVRGTPDARCMAHGLDRFIPARTAIVQGGGKRRNGRPWPRSFRGALIIGPVLLPHPRCPPKQPNVPQARSPAIGARALTFRHLLLAQAALFTAIGIVPTSAAPFLAHTVGLDFTLVEKVATAQAVPRRLTMDFLRLLFLRPHLALPRPLHRRPLRLIHLFLQTAPI